MIKSAGVCVNLPFTIISSINHEDMNDDIFSELLEVNSSNKEISDTFNGIFERKPKMVEVTSNVFFPKSEKRVYCTLKAVFFIFSHKEIVNDSKGDFFGYFFTLEGKLEESQIKEIYSNEFLDHKHNDKYAAVIGVNKEYIWTSKILREKLHMDDLDLLNPNTLEDFLEKNTQNVEYCNTLNSIFIDKPKTFVFGSQVEFVHGNEVFSKTSIVYFDWLILGQVW